MVKFQWKRRSGVETTQHRLWREAERSEDAFLTALDRLVRQRNSALRRGRLEAAVTFDDGIREVLRRREQWAGGGLLQSVIKPEAQASQSIQKSQVPLYITSSLFLRDCYAYLIRGNQVGRRHNTANEPEWACAVTGLRIGQVRTLEQLLPVKIAYQSVGGVRLTVEGLQQVLFSLHGFGHALHAVFHSHRMHGPDGAQPSTIDLRTQEHVLEPAYLAIQAVFTEDGYVHFFAFKRDFEVEIYGKGVERVEDKLYRLQQVRDEGWATETLSALPVTRDGISKA
jgi:hypothetical protein